MTVFEIARIPAKSSANITNPSHEQGAALQTVLVTLSKQPGFRSNLFGKDLNEENVCYIITGWQSLQAHENFIASEQYESFFNAAGAFLAGAPLMRHVDIAALDTLSKESLGGISTLQLETWYFLLDVDRTTLGEAYDRESEGIEGLIGGGWIAEELDGKCAFVVLTCGKHDASTPSGFKTKAWNDLAGEREVSFINIPGL